MNVNDSMLDINYLSITLPPTAIGKTSKMSVDIPPFHEDREFFKVERLNCIDSLDEICFIEYKSYVPKNKKQKILVVFSPKVAFCRICNSFELLERNGYNLNIVAYTESIGPMVEVSTEEIQFICNTKIEERKKVLELKNVSSIETLFQFDIDPQQGFFSVDKIYGKLLPNNYLYINVYYRGKVPGIHSTKLACLIENCPPVMVNVSAINSINTWAKDKKLCSDITNFINYTIPRNESIGFKGYLQDITPIIFFDPPFSITRSYIDFGFVKCDATPSQHVTGHGFSVTNHMKKEIYIIWDVDVQEVFTISPSHCTIKSDECEYFETTFRPKEEDKLYGAILHGSIYWSSAIDDVFTIPIPLSIRFIGHSFAPNHGGWIPQVTLKPTCITMPPCLPSFCCYKTLTLHKIGILPTLFKFIAPENTNYILKPMAGLLKLDYQIVVISLCSSREIEDVYYENWKIILNDNPDYIINFQIRGKTEFPTLEVGDDNCIKFNNCRTWCQQGSLVKIQNKTRHSIKYDLTIPKYLKKCLEVYDDTGIIMAHQCIYVFWLWTGLCNGYRCVEYNIKTTAVQYKETIIGMPQDIKLSICGMVTPSELCSIPSYHYYDECEFDSTFKVEFYLYNFGESEVHYELECLCGADCDSQEVTIIPLFGTIQPRGKEKIKVAVTPHDIGLKKFRIIYNIRKNMYSDEIVDATNKVVYTLDYFCVLPTFQIVDILHENFTPLFSKISLWQLLNIDSINKTLKDIQPNEYKKVYMYFPDAYVTADYTLFLKLKNTSNYTLKVSIERKKLCECKKVERSAGISIRKIVYECPHRETIAISPKNLVIEGKSIANLDFIISYQMSQEITLGFLMRLPHNREIDIFMKIRGIHHRSPLPSSLIRNDEFQFQDIYVGTQAPIIQLLWLYNNTDEVTKYSVYTTSIIERNNELGSNIIQCLNPVGTINPMSNYPIKFIFSPKEMRRYESYTSISFNDLNCFNLKLVGNGIMFYKYFLPLLWGANPRKPPEVQKDDFIKLSNDRIVIKSMHLFNTEERFLFIENITSIIVGYRWSFVKIPNILRINVIQRKGVLKPNEKRSLRIKITAEKQACIIHNAVLSCEVFDVKQRRKYETTRVEFNLHKQNVEDFSMPENTIEANEDTSTNIMLCPKISYHTISVSCLILWPSPEIDIIEKLPHQLEHEPEMENYETLRTKGVLSEADEDISIQFMGNIEKDKLFFILHISKNILQCTITKVLNSEEFKQNVLRFSKKPAPYYGQLVESNNHTKIMHGPSDKTVASLFRKLTLLSLTSLFGLKSMCEETNRRIFENPIKFVKHKCHNCSTDDDDYEDFAINILNKSVRSMKSIAIQSACDMITSN